MDDLPYLLSVAFSGSDLTRAIILGVIGALLTSRRFGPMRMTLILCIIDRVWPFGMMAVTGYEMQAIAAAVAHAFSTLLLDAVPLILRALGIFAAVAGGFYVRLGLHAMLGASPARA